jgi:hypothetical protein
MRLKRLVVISIALVAACKSPTPSEQMDSVQSWLGTADMVGDAWLRHIYSLYEVPWQDMDLSDPNRPKLRSASRDLRHAR